jgi:putative membrane protein
MLVDDHIGATERLREAIGTAADAEPSPLDSAQQAKLRELQASQEPEFNHLFLDIQKAANQEALALHRGYATGGNDAALRFAAAEFAELAQKHLNKVETIRGTRSAPPPRG